MLPLPRCDAHLKLYYRKTSSINRTKSQSLNVSCILAQVSIHWSQVLSWEWRCSWSSADRRCSNYIWVINNFIAYKGGTYIRGFTVGLHYLFLILAYRLFGAEPLSKSMLAYRELESLNKFYQKVLLTGLQANNIFLIMRDHIIKWKHFTALLALGAWNSPVTGEFPLQRPVTRSFDVFFDLRLNEQWSKQSRRWWFETSSRSLWCHCNALSLVRRQAVISINVDLFSIRPFGQILSKCVVNWSPSKQYQWHLNLSAKEYTQNASGAPGLILPIRIKFNLSMDTLLNPLQSMERYHFSISNLQRCSCWGLGMDK